jgi:hypothetical protein
MINKVVFKQVLKKQMKIQYDELSNYQKKTPKNINFLNINEIEKDEIFLYKLINDLMKNIKYYENNKNLDDELKEEDDDEIKNFKEDEDEIKSFKVEDEDEIKNFKVEEELNEKNENFRKLKSLPINSPTITSSLKNENEIKSLTDENNFNSMYDSINIF